MIKKLYITVALAGGALLSSCDSYLDIQPVGVVIPETLTEYRELFNTAYEKSYNDRAVCDMRTADVIIRSDKYDQNSYGDLQKWNDKSSNSAAYEFGWDNYYSSIFYANAIIDKKHEIKEGTTEDINQLVGEAYMMRAYLHFNLVNLYGQPYTKDGALDTKSIPLKLNVDLEEVPTRNTVSEVYASVLKDIQTARELMTKDKWDLRYSYRFSTLSADALESRVRLYMGDWENCYSLSETVLGEKSDLVDFNSESFVLPNNYQSVEIITAYEKVYSSNTSKAVLATKALLDIYDENDLRVANFYKENNENTAIIKTDGSTYYRCSFRTAEYYLNSAEAAARLNNLTGAKTRILELMATRYSNEGYVAKAESIQKMNQEELITEILNERRRELAFEGHNWFDLRRTTRPSITKVIDDKEYILAEDDARYTLTIPSSAISANPGLAN